MRETKKWDMKDSKSYSCTMPFITRSSQL